MSLRTLQGIRINGLRGGGGVGAETWLSVRDLQMALAVYAYEHRPGIPGPGTIDGRWGSRTEASLEAAMVRGGLTATDNIEINDDRTQIKWQQAIGNFVASYAPDYRPHMTAATSGGVQPSGDPASGAGTVLDDPLDNVPSDSGSIIPSGDGYIYQPPSRSYFRRIPWWGWILIAVAVSGAGYGAYYWWKKSKRR